MDEMYQINLEEGMPSANNAIDMLKKEIDFAKQKKEKYLFVIHGYGSSGRGGEIRHRVRQLLNTFRKNGKVKEFICGEDFTPFNNNARELLLIHKDLKVLVQRQNHGITIILL